MAKILIADDSQNLCKLLVDYLSSVGHVCHCAGNGRIAEEMLNLELYDLFLTDILMPEQEGLETILTLRKNNRDLKIIAMSGYNPLSELSLKQAKMFGASKTLLKPFRFEDLKSEIDLLLNSKPAR